MLTIVTPDEALGLLGCRCELLPALGHLKVQWGKLFNQGHHLTDDARAQAAEGLDHILGNEWGRESDLREINAWISSIQGIQDMVKHDKSFVKAHHQACKNTHQATHLDG